LEPNHAALDHNPEHSTEHAAAPITPATNIGRGMSKARANGPGLLYSARAARNRAAALSLAQLIARFRLLSSLSRNWLVVSQGWSARINIARSRGMSQTRSKASPNRTTSG